MTPWIRRMKFNPNEPRPQQGLWVLPAMIVIAGLMLAYGAWLFQGLAQ